MAGALPVNVLPELSRKLLTDVTNSGSLETLLSNKEGEHYFQVYLNHCLKKEKYINYFQCYKCCQEIKNNCGNKERQVKLSNDFVQQYLGDESVFLITSGLIEWIKATDAQKTLENWKNEASGASCTAFDEIMKDLFNCLQSEVFEEHILELLRNARVKKENKGCSAM